MSIKDDENYGNFDIDNPADDFQEEISAATNMISGVGEGFAEKVMEKHGNATRAVSVVLASYKASYFRFLSTISPQLPVEKIKYILEKEKKIIDVYFNEIESKLIRH